MPKFTSKIKNLDEIIDNIITSKASGILNDLKRARINIGNIENITQNQTYFTETDFNDFDTESKSVLDSVINKLRNIITDNNKDLTDEKATKLAKLAIIYTWQGTIASLTKIIGETDSFKIIYNNSSLEKSLEEKISDLIKEDHSLTNLDAQRIANNKITIHQVEYNIFFPVNPNSIRQVVIQDEKLLYSNNLVIDCFNIDKDFNKHTTGSLLYQLDLDGNLEMNISSNDNHSLDWMVDFMKDITNAKYIKNNDEKLVTVPSELTRDQIKILVALEKIISNDKFDDIYQFLPKICFFNSNFKYQNYLDATNSEKLGVRNLEPLINYCKKNYKAIIESNNLLDTTKDYYSRNSLVSFFYYLDKFIQKLRNGLQYLTNNIIIKLIR
jgi:hypothetical protein